MTLRESAGDKQMKPYTTTDHYPTVCYTGEAETSITDVEDLRAQMLSERADRIAATLEG